MKKGGLPLQRLNNNGKKNDKRSLLSFNNWIGMAFGPTKKAKTKDTRV